jgi:hypothetical protein
MWSIGTVLKTCRRFKLIIYGSNKKLLIAVNYIGSLSTVPLNKKLVRNLVYSLEFQFRNSRLLLLLEFKPVDPERETESYSEYPVNVLLWVEPWWVTEWVEQLWVTHKALQLLRWFISKISKYPQTPIILLLKGDSIFSKHQELLKKVRELRSLKALVVIDGSPTYWSKLDSFKELEFVYFTPNEQYRKHARMPRSIAHRLVWTIDTLETIFIIDSSVEMIPLYGKGK